jgi:hypothetical protein
MAKRSHSRNRLQRWRRRHDESVAGERAGPPPAPRPLRSRRAIVLKVALQTTSVLACIGVAFALVRLVGAVSDAHAYSGGSTSVSQMTVMYAGLKAPLASSHPGTRAPQRLCLVTLASGGTQYAAILDGRGVLGAARGRPAAREVMAGARDRCGLAGSQMVNRERPSGSGGGLGGDKRPAADSHSAGDSRGHQAHEIVTQRRLARTFRQRHCLERVPRLRCSAILPAD